MNTKYLPVLSALIALAVMVSFLHATAEEAEPATGAVTEPAADAEAAAALVEWARLPLNGLPTSASTRISILDFGRSV